MHREGYHLIHAVPYSPNRLIVDEATADDNSGTVSSHLISCGKLTRLRQSRPLTPRQWRCSNSSVEILSSSGRFLLHCWCYGAYAFVTRGKKRRDTVLICLSSDDVEEGRIQMNKVARNNLRVKLGDLVNVHQCLDIKYGKRVHILPFDDSIEGLSGNIFDVYLKPYFLEGTRYKHCRGVKGLIFSTQHTDLFARAIPSLSVAACERWSSRLLKPTLPNSV